MPLRLLGDFVDNREKYIRLAQSAYVYKADRQSTSPDDAKNLFIARLNGGPLRKWVADMKVASRAELHPDAKGVLEDLDICREVIIQSRKQNLTDFAEFDRPELALFSYVVAEFEDAALQQMEAAAVHLGIPVDSLCYDGLILNFAGATDWGGHIDGVHCYGRGPH